LQLQRKKRRIKDASADSLAPFIEDSVEPASVVHTDGWPGYLPLEDKDYRHKVTRMKGNSKTASELMPRVHRVASLLKRWLLETHQGGVSVEHLDACLDEFTFRFNLRKSHSRGQLFYRLLIWSDRVNFAILWGCSCRCFCFSRTERAAVLAGLRDD
jgi:transposase-like protein